jgi:hypothetical protein
MDIANMPEINMNPQVQAQQPHQVVAKTRSTGGKKANKRYKRTPEELLADIEKVDALVASGKFNQIEALHKVGLQSSVYHLKKRQLRAEPAHSNKPRKFAPRPNRRKTTVMTKPAKRSSQTQGDFETRKAALMKELEQRNGTQVPTSPTEVQKLQEELVTLRGKYDKLAEYVVENHILTQH